MMTPESQTKLKTILITGGTDGLGRGAALFLAARGYRVFAGGRNEERRAALERVAREKQLPIETMPLDVCDDLSARAAVEQVLKTAGPVDVLINNAGIAIGAVSRKSRWPIFTSNSRRIFSARFAWRNWCCRRCAAGGWAASSI